MLKWDIYPVWPISLHFTFCFLYPIFVLFFMCAGWRVGHGHKSWNWIFFTSVTTEACQILHILYGKLLTCCTSRTAPKAQTLVLRGQYGVNVRSKGHIDLSQCLCLCYWPQKRLRVVWWWWSVGICEWNMLFLTIPPSVDNKYASLDLIKADYIIQYINFIWP